MFFSLLKNTKKIYNPHSIRFFTHKKPELDALFSKNIKTQPLHKTEISPSTLLSEFEKKVKNTNIKVLKRELFNDSMQLPIKYMAYMCAGHGSSGTFYAELMRSSIDAVNHFLLFLTNYIDVKPTKKYPYGIENIKYIVVLVPAFLFFSFGV